MDDLHNEGYEKIDFLESDDEQKGKKNKEFIIIGILAVALLASLGYNIYQGNRLSNHNDQVLSLNSSLTDTNSQRDALQTELDKLNVDYEELKAELDGKDELLEEKDEEIQAKRKEIEDILNKKNITDKDLLEAQNKINALTTEINNYKKEIALLKEENDSLVTQTTILEANKYMLKGESAKQRQRADASESKLKQTEDELSSTFTLANLKLTGLKVRKSGKEVEKTNSKRVDKLNVSFDIQPSQTVETGTTDLYIAIYKPDGSLGVFENSQPGQLETWTLGTVDYSDVVQVDYEKGKEMHVAFDWVDYKFEPGDYKVVIYQNKIRIGQKVINLR